MGKRVTDAIRNAMKRPVMQRMKVETPEPKKEVAQKVSRVIEKKSLDGFIPKEFVTKITKEEVVNGITVTYTTTTEKTLLNDKESVNESILQTNVANGKQRKVRSTTKRK